MTIDVEHLQGWVGREESQTVYLDTRPAQLLSATLDRSSTWENLSCIPVCWHWIYFTPSAQQSKIGLDGHPTLGGLLPPVPLPHRMWASNKIHVQQPLNLGHHVTKTSRICSIESKTGNSGDLIFVNVEHKYSIEDMPCLQETQNLVYKGNEQKASFKISSTKLAPSDEDWSRSVELNPVLLFRFSALTFNSHRIHYDRDYAVSQEHYPDLVVQGPLLATLLLDLFTEHSPHKAIYQFDFRAVHPLYVSDKLTLCGKISKESNSACLWTRNQDGVMTMQATVKFEV